uniref:Uncharacterized protein n=1 Tax=Arion vulgaris TaxID=1028688 RepID=A0A0B7AI04_9EUPU
MNQKPSALQQMQTSFCRHLCVLSELLEQMIGHKYCMESWLHCIQLPLSILMKDVKLNRSLPSPGTEQ